MGPEQRKDLEAVSCRGFKSHACSLLAGDSLCGPLFNLLHPDRLPSSCLQAITEAQHQAHHHGDGPDRYEPLPGSMVGASLCLQLLVWHLLSRAMRCCCRHACPGWCGPLRCRQPYAVFPTGGTCTRSMTRSFACCNPYHPAARGAAAGAAAGAVGRPAQPRLSGGVASLLHRAGGLWAACQRGGPLSRVATRWPRE